MKTNQYIIKSLAKLHGILIQISDEEFSQCLSNLHGSSIGQHSRHIIEFVDCLLKTEQDETICYDDRRREVALEQNRTLFLNRTNELIKELNIERDNYQMKIRYFLGENEYSIVDTNYFREELFVLDHTVHHLAIIKIGITENFPHIKIPSDFGFTASTIRAQNLALSTN